MIGVRGRGRGLTGTFLGTGEANVAYLCDVDQASLERATAVIRKAGAPAPKHTDDMRRVLDDKSIDAVVIATPDHWHSPAAILACDAGKDVYVEKPVSHNIHEGRLVVDAARRKGRIVQHGTQSRSRASTIRGIEYAKSGKIGDVIMAKAWNCQLRDNIGHKEDGPVPDGVNYDTWLGPAPWNPFNENRFHYKGHWHWHFGTGDAGNDGAHQLDIARWALGVSFPKSASGMGGKFFFDDDQQTPDTMNVTFDYGGKALIWEMRIWNPYGLEDQDNGVSVYGTEGVVQIGRWNRKWGFKVLDKAGKLLQHDDADDEADLHMRNFAECVRSRKLPNAETETIVDDPQANLYVKRRYRTHWATPKGV